MTLETIATVLVLWAGSPAADPQAPPQPVLAQVGDRSITADDFRALLIEHRKSGDQQRLVRTLTSDGRRALLQEEIERVRLASAARERGLEQQPAVRLALQRAAD